MEFKKKKKKKTDKIEKCLTGAYIIQIDHNEVQS